MAEVVGADGTQPNSKQQNTLKLRWFMLDASRTLTNLCSEYKILVAVQRTCAGDQTRRTGIKLASPCSP